MIVSIINSMRRMAGSGMRAIAINHDDRPENRCGRGIPAAAPPSCTKYFGSGLVCSGTRAADDLRPLCLRRLLDPCRNADRAAHAGAAQAAISHRVLRQVLLVVVLGE